MAADGVRAYRIPVTRLQRFAALTDTHFALAEAVRDLESEWGSGAPLGKLAKRAGLPDAEAEALIVELSALGLVSWWPAERVAYYEPGQPVLGVVA